MNHCLGMAKEVIARGGYWFFVELKEDLLCGA